LRFASKLLPSSHWWPLLLMIEARIEAAATDLNDRRANDNWFSSM
jgi:hypothetical protein